MSRVLTRASIAAGMMSIPLLCSAAIVAAAATETPLNGPAYTLADAAYKAYARRDYALAAEKTREALRLRPDSRQLAALLRQTKTAQRLLRPGTRNVRRTIPPSAAFTAADAGYKSYAGRDYAAATIHAQRAVQLAPANRDYWLLLANALSAANRLDEADRAIADGIAQAGDDGRLAAQRESIRRRQAETSAAAAFAAIERRDFDAALTHARSAVSLAPANRIYRMTLVQALLLAERFDDAETAASETIALNGDDPSPLVLRAYARQRLNRRADALGDFELALRQPGLTIDASRNIRLIAADAAMAAREPQRALELLQGLPEATDEEAARRLRIARTDLASSKSAVARAMARTMTSTNYPPPTLDCRDSAGPQQCEVLASASRDPSFEVATAAYKAFDKKNYAQAVSDARQAVALSPDNRNHQLLLVNALIRTGEYADAERVADIALAADGEDAALLAQRGFIRWHLGKETLARGDFESALRLGHLPVITEIGLLIDLDRKSEARQRFDRALAGNEFGPTPNVDVAYLAARVGNDEYALAAFERADAAGKLPNTAYQDAAYTAIRARRDHEAIGYFKRAIDDTNSTDATYNKDGTNYKDGTSNNDGIKLRMDPQLRFNTRRAIAEVSRTGGVIASLTYRGAVSGLGPTPGTRTGTDSLQAGAEVYWRPSGYRNGQYFELFVRAFETLYSRSNGATGGGTLQSAAGIRHKPLAETNLVVSLSRVFTPSGRSNDWLAQLGYSGGNGGDLRVDVASWWTTRVSAEAGRYLTARQNYALASVETGKSLRPDGESMWVLFPHLSMAAEYDSTAIAQSSFGIGPGIGARYWFRDDAYNAPRSWLDMTLQYRFRVGGAERADGVFLTTTLSY